MGLLLGRLQSGISDLLALEPDDLLSVFLDMEYWILVWQLTR